MAELRKKFLKDKGGNRILPITHMEAVKDSQGNSLTSVLEDFENGVMGLVRTPHQNYVTVEATSSTTDVKDVLPASGRSADTIYRVSNWDGSANSGYGGFDATVYSEYAWDDVSDPNKYIFLCVKSQIGEVFDISVYNNAKYADLAAALNGGANIPQSLQKGGMSVKFVLRSDNKYVQYRLMADEWSADTNDWAIAEEGVYVENPEFVYVKTDKDDKILWAIKVDGSIYYGAGVPRQVKDYIDGKIAEVSPEGYEQVIAFLNDYLESDTTLKILLDGLDHKIDVETQRAEGVEKAICDKISVINTVSPHDDKEEIVIATDDGKEIISISAKKCVDEDEVIEFGNDEQTENFAKIGYVGGKKGVFAQGFYDINGNPINGFEIDTENEVMIVGGRKYKLIPYIETI